MIKIRKKGVIIALTLLVFVILYAFSGVLDVSAKPSDNVAFDWNSVLQRDSTHIFTGTVQSVESKWVEEPDGSEIIRSYALISVGENVKGDTTSQIMLTYEGGTVYENDNCSYATLIVFINPWGVIDCRVGDQIKAFALQDAREVNLFNVQNVEVLSRIGKETEKETKTRSGSMINIYETYQLNFAWWGPDWSGGSPTDWWFNEDGTDDIGGSSITQELQAVKNSFNTWENEGYSNKDYRYKGTTSLEKNCDNYNVFCWQTHSQETWAGKTYDFYQYFCTIGDWMTWDIVLNDRYTWCIGQEQTKWDVQNIATHEVGHTLKLRDLYDSTNSAQTMYYASDPNQINKRTLESGDKAGIQYIYPKYTKPSVSITQPYESQTVSGNIKIAASASSSSGISWVKYNAVGYGYAAGWTSMTYNSGTSKWEGWWDTTETTWNGYYTIVVRVKAGNGIYNYDDVKVYVSND